VRRGDVTGAVADLGILVPLAAALILVNGLDASGVFIGAGLLVIASGLYFQIPFPVQPLKALTAVAVAQKLGPHVINAAGIEIALFLALLAIGGVADRVARIFTKPVVRALQVGVGILLVVTAIRLVAHPPAVFLATPPSPWPFLLAAVCFVAVWWAAHNRRYEIALVMLFAGIAVAWIAASPQLGAPRLTLPSVGLPDLGHFASAFVLLVVPQLPLTFGNAVVAVTDVARGTFGERAARVRPSRVCLSCAAGNVFSAVIGGMPMCHGAGGLTAHVRLGARTKWMNVGLGCAFLVLGTFFAAQVPAILGLFPVWALAAFLLYAGVRHAWLVADLRGTGLAVALAAGGIGAWRGNLALTVAIGLGYEVVTRVRTRESAIA
jgi:sulfate permease, SulP family